MHMYTQTHTHIHIHTDYILSIPWIHNVVKVTAEVAEIAKHTKYTKPVQYKNIISISHTHTHNI